MDVFFIISLSNLNYVTLDYAFRGLFRWALARSNSLSMMKLWIDPNPPASNSSCLSPLRRVDRSTKWKGWSKFDQSHAKSYPGIAGEMLEGYNCVGNALG